MPEHLAMTHTELIDGVNRSAEFMALRGTPTQELTIEPLFELGRRLKAIGGYQGLLGVGYPFYALDADSPVRVPSIDAYLQVTKNKISQSANACGESWPCAECQVVNKLPNLTDNCVPCDRVIFKPRDLFRALPDIDAIAVFEETTDAVEIKVGEILTAMNFIRFNRNIKGAFDSTMDALNGVGSARLPIDFHIVTAAQLTEALDKMMYGSLEQQVGIKSRAWRATWKDQAVDISYSFAFSMTEIDQSDIRLSDLITSTRRALIEKYKVDEIISMVARSRRCGAVIGNVALRKILEKRIQSW